MKRVWAMPDKNTFSIKPIKELIGRYSPQATLSVDPFANNAKLATVTNDLDPQYNTDYHLDALDFLKLFDDGSVDLILYDPPYSPRQVSESYRKLDRAVNRETTQGSYWSRQKDEIARIIRPGGISISCGWNSNGVGKNRGFEIIEILLVAHGGNHNDTIVTVEQKTML